MFKQSKFLIFLIFLVGCFPKKGYIGTYYSKKNNTMMFHTLLLKEDSTFFFSERGHLVDAKSNGFWSVTGSGDIILNSEDSLKPGVIKVKEKIVLPKEFIEINVVDELDLPLPYASIVLNENLSEGYNLNENGRVNFGYLSIKSIRVHFLGGSYDYKVDDSNSNLFVLKIRLEKESIIYFDNELWKFKGGILIDQNHLILSRNGHHGN